MRSARDGHHVHASTTILPGGGQLWTLQPIQALHDTQADLQHQHELMELARGFGRLGVWERDVRRLQGHWDSQVLRFCGMAPDDLTPDFAKAAECVPPEDRELTDGIVLRSLLKTGPYSMRCRVRGLGGQLRHLFEPFNRLGAGSGAVEGTGTGLAIAKALVERMGGGVSATSTLGQGSVFQMDLAVDGSSGVAQARALLPDLILLDMQLPDFDGYEVLRRLRAEADTAAIPCIALSANAMPHDIGRALKAGMSAYWTKPLDFKAFMASLESLFGKPAG